MYVARPLLVKIIGAHESLIWLKERFSRTRLIVENDNLLVKQILEENLVNYSYFASLVFYGKILIKELPFFLCQLLRNQRIGRSLFC